MRVPIRLPANTPWGEAGDGSSPHCLPSTQEARVEFRAPDFRLTQPHLSQAFRG